MRAAQDGVTLDPGRDGDGAAHAGVGPLGVVDDFLRRRVKRPVVIGFHSNPNPIAVHKSCLFSALSRSTTRPAAFRKGERRNVATFTTLSSCRRFTVRLAIGPQRPKVPRISPARSR